MTTKTNTAEKNAPAASTPNPAPVAPATTGGKAAETKTPREKQDRKVLGGDAFNRLVAAGAVLIVLASKGKLFSSVLSQLGGPVVELKGLPERVKNLTKDWSQFDRGYLVGPAASYGACAVTQSSKKAKATPAFVYAVRGEGKSAPTLMTADGQIWARPAGKREGEVYDAALAAVNAAFAG